MAVLHGIKCNENDWSIWGAVIPDKCFLCDEPLTFPVVFWNGSSGETKYAAPALQIWLHPGCAKILGEHLISDFNSIKP